jgi:hypothetical protein
MEIASLLRLSSSTQPVRDSACSILARTALELNGCEMPAVLERMPFEGFSNGRKERTADI